MNQFSVLGALSLRGGTEVDALLAQPKRVAVLAYLALSRPRGPKQRDTLLALFWPELDGPRARNALSQTLHHLRRALGQSAIVSRGIDRVELDASVVDCDALMFERLVQEGALAQALDLYRGDLLPGFHLGGAPDFERWLDEERGRLRALAGQVAMRLAAEREEAGDLKGAVECCRRALGLAPQDESILRRLLALLIQTAGRAEAVRAYEAFATRLREEFELDPGPETRQMVNALRVPEVLIGRQSRGGDEALPTGAATAAMAPIEAPREIGSPGRRWLGPLAGALLLAVGVVMFPVLRDREATQTPLDSRLVAVVPFRVAGADSSLGYLREGMLDLLAVRLAAGTLVATDPRSALSTWGRMRAPSGPEASVNESRRFATRLGAGNVLVGAVLGSPERLTVSGRLIDVASGRIRASGEAAGRFDSLADLIDQLTSQLLVGSASEPPERLADLTSASLPALEQYLIGREAYRHGDYAGAVQAFRRAVGRDSSFVLAWLHLADAADLIADPLTAEARARAWAMRGRLREVDQAYLVALVGPRYPEPPRPAERLAAWERVVMLDPDRAEGWYGLGDVLFHHGRVLEADSALVRSRAALGRALALDSSYAAPLAHLVQAELFTGNVEAARRLFAQYRLLDSAGDVAEFLRWRVAVATGDSAVLRDTRRRLGQLPRSTLTRIVTWSQLEGVGVGDGKRAYDAVLARSVNAAEQANAADLGVLVLANAGRLAALDSLVEREYPSRDEAMHALRRLSFASQYSSDPGVTAAAVTSASPAEVAENILVRSRLAGGWPVDSARAAHLLAWIRSRPERGLVARSEMALVATACCVSLARREAEEIEDSLSAIGESQAFVVFNLAATLERLNEPARALGVIRRRALDQWLGLPRLAPSLLLEGRLAARVGDTAGAIRAYRHYLALRESADAVLAPEIAGVRASLAALTGRGVVLR